MPSKPPQKPRKKKQPDKPLHELTSDEALDRLFHPEVVEHVKKAIPDPEPDADDPTP